MPPPGYSSRRDRSRPGAQNEDEHPKTPTSLSPPSDHQTSGDDTPTASPNRVRQTRATTPVPIIHSRRVASPRPPHPTVNAPLSPPESPSSTHGLPLSSIPPRSPAPPQIQEKASSSINGGTPNAPPSQFHDLEQRRSRSGFGGNAATGIGLPALRLPGSVPPQRTQHRFGPTESGRPRRRRANSTPRTVKARENGAPNSADQPASHNPHRSPASNRDSNHQPTPPFIDPSLPPLPRSANPPRAPKPPVPQGGMQRPPYWPLSDNARHSDEWLRTSASSVPLPSDSSPRGRPYFRRTRCPSSQRSQLPRFRPTQYTKVYILRDGDFWVLCLVLEWWASRLPRRPVHRHRYRYHRPKWLSASPSQYFPPRPSYRAAANRFNRRPTKRIRSAKGRTTPSEKRWKKKASLAQQSSQDNIGEQNQRQVNSPLRLRQDVPANHEDNDLQRQPRREATVPEGHTPTIQDEHRNDDAPSQRADTHSPDLHTGSTETSLPNPTALPSPGPPSSLTHEQLDSVPNGRSQVGSIPEALSTRSEASTTPGTSQSNPQPESPMSNNTSAKDAEED
jgi:hypothetical protein